MTGKRIRLRAECCKFLQCIAVFFLEHFVFQKMCNTRCHIMPHTVECKMAVNRTEIGRKHGKCFNTVTRNAGNMQTIWQNSSLDLFIQLRIGNLCHTSAPLRK